MWDRAPDRRVSNSSSAAKLPSTTRSLSHQGMISGTPYTGSGSWKKSLCSSSAAQNKTCCQNCWDTCVWDTCVCVCVRGGGGQELCLKVFSTKTLKGDLIRSELGRRKKTEKNKQEGQQTKQGKELCGIMQTIVLPRLLLSLESVRGF